MKLLGRDIPVRDLVIQIGDRLRVRGLPTSAPVEVPTEGVEPRVEPLTYNLNALEEHADPTRGLPLHTHRGGMGQLVLAAKWTFRKTAQVFINETLGRQRVFNGLVRDSYAQLSAEVIRLRREVEELRARGAAAVPAKPAQGSAPREAMPAAKEASATKPSQVTRPSPAAKPSPTARHSSAASARPQATKEALALKGASKGAAVSKGASTASEAPTAKQPSAARGAPAMKQGHAPAARTSAASKQSPATKEATAPARKPASEGSASGAGPVTSSEPVLPKPRHARQEASQLSRTESGRHAGTSDGTAPAAQSTPRQRPPGAKRSRRRKGR